MRAADLRFALPRLPQRVVVVGLPAVATAFAALGLLVDPSESADLVVASADHAPVAVPGGALSVLVGDARSLRRRTRRRPSRQMITMSAADGRGALVTAPVGEAVAGPEVAVHLEVPHARLRRVEVELAARGVVVPGTGGITMLGDHLGPPWAIAEAGRFGVPLDAAWTLLAPGRAEGNRLLLLVAPRGSHHARWAIRSGRRADAVEAFQREEAARAELQRLAPALAAQIVPEHLGMIEGPLPGSVDRFAPGTPLDRLLSSSVDRVTKLRAVKAVCDVLATLGRATRTPPEALDLRRAESQEGPLAHWRRRGAPADLVQRLSRVPGVYQHGDVGGSNVLVSDLREPKVTLLDWEWGRHHEYPLWDLVHLLATSLVTIDGPGDVHHRREATLALFRGELPSSVLLFRRVRRAARQLDIPAEAVGPLVTLFFLQRNHDQLELEAGQEASAPVHEAEPVWSLGERWLSDPALGPEWAAWRL